MDGMIDFIVCIHGCTIIWERLVHCVSACVGGAVNWALALAMLQVWHEPWTSDAARSAAEQPQWRHLAPRGADDAHDKGTGFQRPKCGRCRDWRRAAADQ